VLDAIPFIVLDLVLLVLAARRPWAGLVALLGGLPFNGFLTQVAAGLLGLGPEARVAVAGWHDALAGGILLAAGWTFVRSPDRRLGRLELLVLAVGALGVAYVVLSPVTLTALYAYRTLYEPPFLLAAILVLARRRPVPAWLPGRAALALVGATAISAAYTWIQVYVLKFRYIQTFYTDPGERIHHSYIASGISQPRGIGTFTSPNEFGAGLAIAIALLLVPGLIRIPGWLRSTLLGALLLGLLLTFSRSGILATATAIVGIAWLARGRLPARHAIGRALRDRRVILRHAPQFVLTLALGTAVFVSSGAQTLVVGTVTGGDPSAGNRPESIRQGLAVLVEHPLGLGLGTAGPKAARFGETEGRPRILTETWYLVYAIQVGIGGAALLAALAAAILARLWRARDGPFALACLGVGTGLGIGALFIPIIEDPTVWTPLWVLAALGIAMPMLGRSGHPTEEGLVLRGDVIP